MPSVYSAEKITLNSLDDIVNRPGYAATIQPRKSLFVRVLATYSFSKKIASCSVSDCYQNHKKGYLVATSDGGECSICEACLQRFVDPEYRRPPRPTKARTSAGRRSGTGASTRSPAAPRTAQQPLPLSTFVEESGKIKARVKALKQAPYGANWLFQSLANFRKSYPAELLAALENLATKGEDSPIFATLLEADNAEERLPQVEQLQGLGVFNDDIRTLLIDNILKPLGKLDAIASASPAAQTLNVPLQWANEVEANFERAEALIAEAQRFFTADNLQRLQSIPLSAKAETQVRSLRWDVDKGALKGG